MGRLAGPDGRTYAIRTPRIDRREIEALIEAGCPVVTYFPGGRLVWHDEDDAWPAWADARNNASESVTAGRWEAVDGLSRSCWSGVPTPGADEQICGPELSICAHGRCRAQRVAVAGSAGVPRGSSVSGPRSDQISRAAAAVISTAPAMCTSTSAIGRFVKYCTKPITP
jgi:hypothetical protein